ncbi:TIGR00304 family membrane protein [Vulcanisaeta thermophila]|uniref:TIGR00304 family membrane protein n=1 Tax=Vulcanisaeta thermophila TaxID=867917 RepID=UPI000852A2CE|nr:DUF131 domain-containing protein [Vulcanisaeta thermophila]
MIDLITLAVALSIILAIIGVVLIIVDLMRSGSKEDEERGSRKTGFGGVVLIGPVPIIFGNDSSTIKWAIILTMVVVIIFILLMVIPALVG